MKTNKVLQKQFTGEAGNDRKASIMSFVDAFAAPSLIATLSTAPGFTATLR